MEQGMTWITVGMWVVGLAQGGVTIINLSPIQMLGWKKDVDAMPLLIREVFHVHAWFISITLIIFAVLTCRFAEELAAPGGLPIYRWLATAIALFWGIRTIVQLTYYSSSHWKGQPRRLAAHITLLIVYGGMSTMYAIAGWN